MRILQVIPSLASSDGGPPRVLHGLTAAAAAAGVDVTILSLQCEDATVEWGADSPVRSLTFRASGPRSYRRSGALAKWLGDNGAEFDVFHVHSAFSWTSAASFAAAGMLHKPVVWTPHGALMRQAMLPWALWKHAWLVRHVGWRRGSRPVLHCLSESESVASRLTGLDHFVFAPTWEFRGELPRPGREARRDFVLFLGRIHPVKRLEWLISALARVSGLRLVIAGRGVPAYESDLRERARRYRVEDRITWYGHAGVAEKERLLEQTLALVQPSIFESFGVAVLEAMSRGVPVIVGESVGLAPAVAKLRAGRVVGESLAAWTDALRSVTDDPEQWLRYAANAADWARSLPTKEECGAELRRRYERVCA